LSRLALPGARAVSAILGASVLLMAAPALAPVSGLTLSPPAAHAADTDVVSIPDANLKAKLNAKLSASRSPTADITVGDAKTATGTLTVAGSVADLTGLEAFVNVTTLTLSGVNATANTFTSLQPLAGLTKLTNLTIQSGSAQSLTPLSGLTNLTSLAVARNQVTDASPLAPLGAKLTTLNLTGNRIADLTKLPSLPNVTNLGLGGNRIVDPAPVLDKIDSTKLATLNLSTNRITNASALVPLGNGKVGQWAAVGISAGLNLSSNRITDFTPFDSWASPPAAEQTASQQLYVGAYRAGGVQVPVLKQSAAIADPLKVDPPTAGSYDAATRTVTATDANAASVTLSSQTGSALSPRFVVNFSNPPVEPGDPTGPTVSGASQLGVMLSVTDVGPAMASCAASAITYRWLRDGQEFTGNKNPSAQLLDMGGPGDSAVYQISATDVGHQLQVRLSCTGTGVTSTSTPAFVAGEEAEKPVVQPLLGGGGLSLGSPLRFTGTFPSAVLGDPTNPTTSIYVGQLNAANQLVDPSGLQVSASVSYPANYTGARPIADGDVQIIGTGAERTIAVTPHAAMPALVDRPATITVTVTGTTGKTTTLTFPYYVSVQTTPTSRVLLGSSDASTAIAVGDGYLLVADDEKPAIRLYDATVSGREVAQFSPGALPSGFNNTEIDFESSARKGDSIFWLGSHGNAKDGEVQPNRWSVYETKLTGAGASAKLTPTGTRYGNLRPDLVAWDQVHGNRLGLAAATVGSPDELHGFNIEGAEFSPDNSQLYLGFRSPVTPAQVGGKAIIVPVTNIQALTQGTATQATFADPILLDLAGDSIREIRKNARNEYLILSAPAGPPGSGAPKQQRLWAWNGDPALAPRLLTTVLPTDVEPRHSDNAGAWEGIGEMPDRLAPGRQVRLIMDQGYAQFYGDRGENKKDGNDFTNKARTDLVTLAGPAGTVAELSGPGTFGSQAANTIGTAKKVTVTNNGSNVLNVGRVYTEGADQDAANDFLISNNGCTGKTLAVLQSCTLFVRFAPSRENATSTASLVVESDVPDGRTTLALTGSSATLPQGPTGPAGADGADGVKGDKGDAGSAGANGVNGAAGSNGAKGDAGATGATGSTGATGAQGPQGPQGPAGPVSVNSASASGSEQPTITVDSKGRIVVSVRNADAKALKIRVRARATIGGKPVTIATRTITVKAGASAKVALTVDKAARRKLGHGTHKLEVTATPLSGSNRKAGQMTGKIAVHR
jgi:hypothetical protein